MEILSSKLEGQGRTERRFGGSVTRGAGKRIGGGKKKP